MAASRSPFLTPGAYDVRAELSGFKAVEQKGVNVPLEQTVSVNLRLEVGGLTEIVRSWPRHPSSTPRSTTIGAVLDTAALASIPVGRRFSDALYLAPGVSSCGNVWSRRTRRFRGGSGLENQYVVDGVNVTNTGYGAIGLLFDHLRVARQRHDLRLHQGNPGQDRRLRGRVRPGHRRRGQRDHQERHEQRSPAGVRVFAPGGAARAIASSSDLPTVSENAAQKTIRSATSASRRAARSSGTGCSSSAPSTHRGRRDDVAACRLPAGEPWRSRPRDRHTTSYSAKGTLQLGAATASTPRSSATRRTARTVRSAPRRSCRDRHDGVQRARLRRPQPDRPVRRRPEQQLAARRRRLRARATRSARSPSVNEWRITDQTVTPNMITGGIGILRGRQRQPQQPVHGQDHQHLRRPPDQVRRPVRRRRSTRRSTSAPGRRSPRRTAARRQPGATITVVPDSLRPDLSRDARELQLARDHRAEVRATSSRRTRGAPATG